MAFEHEIQPIEASDEELRAVLEQAQLPSLLVALAHATGDASLLSDDLLPDCRFVAGPQGGYDEARIARAKDVCHAALVRLRDAGPVAGNKPDDALLRRMLGFLVGSEQLDEVMPLLLGELGLDGEDARAPRWKKDEIAPNREFEVAIIGAGMSGLAARCAWPKPASTTWCSRRTPMSAAPGSRTPTPAAGSTSPTTSTATRSPRRSTGPSYYSTQGVLLDYFRECADTLDLRRSSSSRPRSLRSAWSDDTRVAGRSTLRTADGDADRRGDVVISAVGQLNRPADARRSKGARTSPGPPCTRRAGTRAST